MVGEFIFTERKQTAVYLIRATNLIIFECITNLIILDCSVNLIILKLLMMFLLTFYVLQFIFTIFVIKMWEIGGDTTWCFYFFGTNTPNNTTSS